MSQMEDAISSILNDPSSMEKISQMAASLFGSGGETREKARSSPSPDGFDPEMLSRIGRLMSRSDSGSSGKTALLQALSPFLAEKRRQKLEKAVRLAQMARLAGVAFEEYGGSKGV